jgi:Sulfate permease family
MSGKARLIHTNRTPYFEKIAPGLARLLKCQRSDLSHDVFAGLSVAAVALPVGVAYAQLPEFNPVVGLYSTILPLLACAIFGTSRQLIIGPEHKAHKKMPSLSRGHLLIYFRPINRVS